MQSILRSLAFAALANIGSFGLTAWLLPGFSIHLGGFLVAVVVFTLLAVALRRVTATLAPRLARPSAVLGGLVVTAVALVLTDALVPGEGFDLRGPVAWVTTVLVVWAAGVAYGEVDTQAPADVPPVDA
jgi:uncharacterized membrane protein YidH (DUF202 family)